MGRFVYHYFCFLPKGKKDLCHVKSEKISNEEVKLYRLHHINKGILYGKILSAKATRFFGNIETKPFQSKAFITVTKQNKKCCNRTIQSNHINHYQYGYYKFSIK